MYGTSSVPNYRKNDQQFGTEGVKDKNLDNPKQLRMVGVLLRMA
jgi:hypothetical protein